MAMRLDGAHAFAHFPFTRDDLDCEQDRDHRQHRAVAVSEQEERDRERDRWNSGRRVNSASAPVGLVGLLAIGFESLDHFRHFGGGQQHRPATLQGQTVLMGQIFDRQGEIESRL